VSVVLLVEHSLHVKLLCDCSVELGSTGDCYAKCVLNSPRISVCVGAQYHYELLVVRGVSDCQWDNVVQREVFLVHALHGACLGRGNACYLALAAFALALTSHAFYHSRIV